MCIYAIRDDNLPGKDLGFLIAFPSTGECYIELPSGADEWETPLLLSSFVKRGEYSVNAHWTREWMRQRIVPEDRQNLGQVLKENGLMEYDELQLLLLADGRCAQDSCYIAPVEALPEDIQKRQAYKLEKIEPRENFSLHAHFRDGKVADIDAKALLGGRRQFAPILQRQSIFDTVSLQTAGYGIQWGQNCRVSDKELYDAGT